MLDHKSLPQTVEGLMRRRIINNELPAGERLIEANLAAEFGVSRATIREATRALAAEGLVEIIPRRGSVVTRMSAADAEDVCFARYVLESGMATSLTAAQRRALQAPLLDALRAMERAAVRDDFEAVVDADVQFHGVIVAASGRRRAGELWGAVNGQMGALMRAAVDRHHYKLERVRERHEAVFTAVVSGTSRQIDRALRDHYLDGIPLVMPDNRHAG